MFQSHRPSENDTLEGTADDTDESNRRDEIVTMHKWPACLRA